MSPPSADLVSTRGRARRRSGNLPLFRSNSPFRPMSGGVVRGQHVRVCPGQTIRATRADIVRHAADAGFFAGHSRDFRGMESGHAPHLSGRGRRGRRGSVWVATGHRPVPGRLARPSTRGPWDSYGSSRRGPQGRRRSRVSSVLGGAALVECSATESTSAETQTLVGTCDGHSMGITSRRLLCSATPRRFGDSHRWCRHIGRPAYRRGESAPGRAERAPE
jgi:hypothetical protein